MKTDQPWQIHFARPDDETLLISLSPKTTYKAAKRSPWLTRIGQQAMATYGAGMEMVSFVGAATLAFASLVRGKARYQKSDLALIIQEVGPQALAIVSLISFLVGLILAFVGAVQPGKSLWDATPEEREKMMRHFGIRYQSGALWSLMTLAENVALPLAEYTDLSAAEISNVVSLKLALVGLAGFEDFYPAQISGGMRKRAGLARAIALDPDILFFDEPSAGLDPISSRRMRLVALTGQ